MAELKYAKHVVRDIRSPAAHKEIVYPAAFLRGGENWGVDFQMNWECISEPFVMEKGGMVHDFDQFLCFMGSDATNIFDFDAEVELCLGEEREKYIIDSPTVVYIPAGMVHGPLYFHRIGKPILFHNIIRSGKYTRRSVEK